MLLRTDFATSLDELQLSGCPGYGGRFGDSAAPRRTLRGPYDPEFTAGAAALGVGRRVGPNAPNPPRTHAEGDRGERAAGRACGLLTSGSLRRSVSEKYYADRVSRVIARTSGGPITRARLVDDLRALGVREGMSVLVHSSLASLGWVVGDSESVVLALEEAVGSEGTLMMPGFSYDAPEPSGWKNPPVPQAWWETIRREWPPFDPTWARSQHVGVIAETFRTQPGTLRSPHPALSFTARGPHAPQLVERHGLENAAGESSPLARLYELDGRVLLLGVDHGSNTSLHLAETRARWPGREKMASRTARWVRLGRVETVTLNDFEWHEEEFAELGRDFESRAGNVAVGPVGMSTSRLMRQRDLVDFGVRWIESHRNQPAGPESP